MESGCEGPGTLDACRAKAARTLASARHLLDIGDAEGACNRSYYAVFYAAHVALFAVGLGEAAMAIRSHSGLNSMFHKEIIKSGKLAVEIGQALDQIEQLRLSSDYFDGTSTLQDASWAVGRAETFCKAVDALVPPR